MEEVMQDCHPNDCPIMIMFASPNANQRNCMPLSLLKEQSPSYLKLASETAETSGGECRICLEGSDGGQLIKYCRCTGTAQLCHEHCLSSWINRQLADSKKRIQCEICLRGYDYDEEIQEYFSSDYFKENLARKKGKIICYTVFYVTLLVVFLAFLGFLVKSRGEYGPFHSIIAQKRSAVITSIVLLISLGLLLIVASYAFLKQYFFKKEVKIRLRKIVKVCSKPFSQMFKPIIIRKGTSKP